MYLHWIYLESRNVDYLSWKTFQKHLYLTIAYIDNICPAQMQMLWYKHYMWNLNL